MIPSRLRSSLASPAATWWAAGAAILLAAPSLFSELQGDDFIFLAEVQAGASAIDLFDPFHFSTQGQEHVSVLKARGELPWWVDNGARLRFWRPITSVSHFLDFSLWPEAAWLMHAQNLAWYVLLIFLAATLYRRLSGQAWVAGLATWLYAVDDCHAQPVGWITARNTIMGAAVGSAGRGAQPRPGDPEPKARAPSEQSSAAPKSIGDVTRLGGDVREAESCRRAPASELPGDLGPTPMANEGCSLPRSFASC